MHGLNERDSMLAVGQKPWHGLGVVLAEPPKTGLEALEIAGLDWQVEKQALFLGDGRQVRLIDTADKSTFGAFGAIVRTDTSDMLGVVGPGYRPYQNRDMAALFDPLLADGTCTIETCGSLFGGKRVWMLAKIAGEQQHVASSADKIDRYLMLAHGHDGVLAVRFGFTYVRVVCNNTLSLAIRNRKESSLMKCLHTTNLKTNLEVLRDSMLVAEERFAMTADQYRILASRGVSRADLRRYASILVEAGDDEAKWTKRQREKIGQIVGNAIEGRGNSGKTWWDAYNGATEYLTWQASKTSQVRFNNLWFGQSATKNNQALELALELAS